jgi:putative ABC transport system substrate-binding protein
MIQHLMHRRSFLTVLGTSAAARPPAARAQQRERVRRVGVLMGYPENDADGQLDFSEFVKGFAGLGWVTGRNIAMDVRWTGSDIGRMRKSANELAALQPAVIMGTTTPAIAELQRATRTIPIVFAAISDPVGNGFVASLARPGGNITGFINMEAALSGKWLELLTEIAPSVRRVAMIFNPETAPGNGSYYLPSFEAAARSFKIEPIDGAVHSEAEIENVVKSLAGEPAGGLIDMPDAFLVAHVRRS